MTYRALRIKGLEQDLIIARATELRLRHTTKAMFMADERPDGTWLIQYTDNLGDISKLQKISMPKSAKPIAPKNEPVMVTFEGWDKALPVTKAIKTNNPVGQIWLEQGKDGNYTLLYSENLTELRNGFDIDVIREEVTA